MGTAWTLCEINFGIPIENDVDIIYFFIYLFVLINKGYINKMKTYSQPLLYKFPEYYYSGKITMIAYII